MLIILPENTNLSIFIKSCQLTIMQQQVEGYKNDENAKLDVIYQRYYTL